ncbi:hypothetical protein [Spirulina sp. 06S082]|uniref:hypothetical protein n=1 Tax=Spirulina sp. 06S082 TaxID=3110248 RepID=UPI002B209947|nr:hypothetical protein [Spirulina sp. 06S082]MEA5468091.1 hypothetical protein [Spirulina sp. 06S082]
MSSKSDLGSPCFSNKFFLRSPHPPVVPAKIDQYFCTLTRDRSSIPNSQEKIGERS